MINRPCLVLAFLFLNKQPTSLQKSRKLLEGPTDCFDSFVSLLDNLFCAGTEEMLNTHSWFNSFKTNQSSVQAMVPYVLQFAGSTGRECSTGLQYRSHCHLQSQGDLQTKMVQSSPNIFSPCFYSTNIKWPNLSYITYSFMSISVLNNQPRCCSKMSLVIFVTKATTVQIISFLHCV